MDDHHRNLSGYPNAPAPNQFTFAPPGTSTSNGGPGPIYGNRGPQTSGLDDIPDIEAYERSLQGVGAGLTLAQPTLTPNHDSQLSKLIATSDSDSPRELNKPPMSFKLLTPKVEVIDDQTPMMSPVSTSAKIPHRGNVKTECVPVLDPDGQDEDPVDGEIYPEPVLFDIKNTIMTEYDLDVLRHGKNNPEEFRRRVELPDASAPPNKICEFLMYHRTLKEAELNQLNSWRTKRNRLSLNLNRGPANLDREFDQKACESLVKKLKDKKHDLQNLIDVVSTKGKKYTGCITIPRTLDGRLQVHGRKGFPHVVYGKLWRFSEMSKNETRHVDHCKHAFEMKSDAVGELQVCVNPYHYEIVIGTMIVGDAPRVMDAFNRNKPQPSNPPPSVLPHTPHHPGLHPSHLVQHHPMDLQHNGMHQIPSHQMPEHQISPHPQHPMTPHPSAIPMPMPPQQTYQMPLHPIPPHQVHQAPTPMPPMPPPPQHQFPSSYGFPNTMGPPHNIPGANLGMPVPPQHSVTPGFGYHEQCLPPHGPLPPATPMHSMAQHQPTMDHQLPGMELSYLFAHHQPIQPDIGGYPAMEGEQLAAEMNNYFFQMAAGHEATAFQNEFDRNYYNPTQQHLGMYGFEEYSPSFMAVDDTPFQAPLTPPPAQQNNKENQNASHDNYQIPFDENSIRDEHQRQLENRLQQQAVQAEIEKKKLLLEQQTQAYEEEKKYQEIYSQICADSEREGEENRAYHERLLEKQQEIKRKLEERREAEKQKEAQSQLLELQPSQPSTSQQQHGMQLFDPEFLKQEQQKKKIREEQERQAQMPQYGPQPRPIEGQESQHGQAEDQQQRPRAPPKPDIRVSLGMFRYFCKQEFGSRFFGTDEEELCTITDRRGSFLEKPNNSLLGVRQIKRVPKPGKSYEGPWTKDAPYPDMANFILNVSSDTMTTNGGEPPTVKNQCEPWAEISYYEHKRMIKQKKNIDRGYIVVDGGYLISENRFSVGVLSSGEPEETPPDPSAKVRSAILDGIKFSYKEDGSIWLSNLMSYPVFITSGYLDDQSVGTRNHKPHKLYGNSKLKVFGLRRVKQVIRDRFYSRQFAKNFLDGKVTSMNHIFEAMDTERVFKEANITQDELTKYCFVRVAFCKGFGEDYPRKTISDTPCWVELKVYGAYNFMDILLSDLQYRFDNLKVNAARLRAMGFDQSDDEEDQESEQGPSNRGQPGTSASVRTQPQPGPSTYGQPGTSSSAMGPMQPSSLNWGQPGTSSSAMGLPQRTFSEWGQPGPSSSTWNQPGPSSS